MQKLFATAAATAVLLSTIPALAGEVTSTVIAHDRVAHRVVLVDKSVFSYNPTAVQVPDTLDAGDEVKIEYLTGGDDGIVKINAITILKEGG